MPSSYYMYPTTLADALSEIATLRRENADLLSAQQDDGRDGGSPATGSGAAAATAAGAAGAAGAVGAAAVLVSAPIDVWLDVDTGVDDAHALLLAARSPALELVGVYVNVV